MADVVRTAGAGQVVLALEDVSKSFGAIAALRGAQLELRGGEAHALVGENGAGKSTLVKLLARMYTPISGRITAVGVDINHTDVSRWRERLSGAFQDFARLEFLAATTVGLGDEPHRRHLRQGQGGGGGQRDGGHRSTGRAAVHHLHLGVHPG